MFEVKTGVRQGCVLSTLLFNFVVDWILSRTIEDKKRGIRWKLSTTLEDLVYADDLAFVSHFHRNMQEKTKRLRLFASITVSSTKTEVMALNVHSPTPIKLGGEVFRYVDRFTYLGSVFTKGGGADEDINRRISKARTAFRMLEPVWR